MSDGFDIPIKAPLPLSAEDAYWHACTGTPWEPEYVFVHGDRHAMRASHHWFLWRVDACGVHTLLPFSATLREGLLTE